MIIAIIQAILTVTTVQ